jgi:hypothetical protein
MKPSIALLALALTLVAATNSAAQVTTSGQRDLNYQNSLLGRSLSPADEAYCASLNASKPPQHDYCKVMRLFLADIKSDQEKGLPPWSAQYYTTYAPDDPDAVLLSKAMQAYP